MTNTPTADARTTGEQIDRLAKAGAQLVRLAVPTREDTASLGEIVARAPVPLVADVHFHFDRALESIDAGVAKIRLNPGNLRDRGQVARVIAAARDAGVVVRVGVNEGSIVERADKDRQADERRRPIVELMVEKMGEYLEVFEEEGFDDLVLSAKSADAVTTVAVNRALAGRWDHPLHLGVTHAGTRETGAIRSSAALGALLSDGIGETIRISYAGDPVHEVSAALELLYSLRLRPRRGVELIACPTCGRLQMDLDPVVAAVRERLSDVEAPIKVAIMGCVVNGPGEAAGADVAICAGKGKAALYIAGRLAETVPADRLIEAVVTAARDAAKETR
jgi:(E)-4-hydroxy-3-methylbut-2-enyl-diphosphate synthase